MPKSILIADDSPYVRMTVRRSLERCDFLRVCGEAENGLEVVEKARLLKPDLILLDLAMPGMNGLDAARVLSSRLPACLMILFTLYSHVVRPSDARAAGVSAVFSKANFGALVMYLENVCRADAEGPASAS